MLHAVNYILKPVNPENFCSSLQEIICRLDLHEIRFANSNQYIQQNFYDQTSWDSSGSYDSTLADDFLLKNIDLAIQLKQIAQLQSLVDELLHKYSAPARQSHIYIRHIATCLLRILMAPIRNLNESDFDAAAGEIYLFRHFSDIEKSVRKYLNLLVVQLKEEVETPSYAVHLVKQYIETHYAQDLTLNFLAEQVYLNPNYLSNVFTKVTGCNISKYVKHVRMKKAQELLRNTNQKIADIGTAVGYPNTSYFIKIFQQQFGTTPERYRNGPV